MIHIFCGYSFCLIDADRENGLIAELEFIKSCTDCPYHIEVTDEEMEEHRNEEDQK